MATIAERKIRESMERGEFDDLAGKGKPLTMDEDLSGVPAELRMAYKVLKDAALSRRKLRCATRSSACGSW